MNCTAAIIIVGNEILSGRTRDHNAWWLATELKKHGVVLRRISVIPDVIGIIVAEVNTLRSQMDYVIVCGGIGPTPDDVTRQAIAAAFGLPCVPHPEAVEILKRHYQDRLTDRRMVMAELPKDAKLIYNPHSGAPGCQVENVFVLPGVPELLEQMFPQVARMLKPGSVVEREFPVSMGESDFADVMDEALTRFPEVEVGSYPSLQDGKWRGALVIKGSDQAKVEEAEKWFRARLSQRAEELKKR